MFRSLLPKAWQSLVVGTFSGSMTASRAEIHDKAIEIGRAANKKRVQKLLDALVTSSAKGQQAVTGISAVLEALSGGRIKTLVSVDNYHEVGYRCLDCGIITADQTERCQACGGPLEVVPDVVEEAIALTLRSGGDVEIIQDLPFVDGANKIGAILRY